MKTEAPKQSVQSQKIESSNEEMSMPGMMPPAFGFADDGGSKYISKDGKRNSKEFEAKSFDGPLAAKDSDDNHAFAEDDVRQGRLNDCWVMAPIAAIVQIAPDYIERIIKPLGDGKYSVTLFEPQENYTRKSTEKVEIIVDAVVKEGIDGEPLYAKRGDDKEIWVLILEKAIAKLLGGYDKLNFGDSSVTFQVILGTESSHNFIDPKERSEEKESQSKAKYEAQYNDWLQASKEGRAKEGVVMNPPEKYDFSTGLKEWEILPRIQELLNQGHAVVLGTNTFDEPYIKVDGNIIFGNHAYTISKID
ncbi:MAG: hypothetical protein RLZZ519_2054, partial [Bacteroidota bacterium]